MTHVRTAPDLQDLLDREFGWRLKEIDDIRKAIRQAENTRRRTLVRAGITLLYAHWEGFVKTTAEGYLNYLAHKKFKYKELRRSLIALGLRGQLATAETTLKPLAGTQALSFIMDAMDKPAKLPFRGAINTESNLSSAVFAAIAGWIGVDSEPYATRAQLIDISLLERRNHVAHGESLDLDVNSYLTLSDDVIALLRHFKTDLENSLTLQSYLAANEPSLSTP